MRLVLLSIGSSIHTIRWANALSANSHEIHLVTMQKPLNTLSPEVKLHLLPIPPPVGYILNVVLLKRLLRRIKPDVLNIHRASGYGTLGRLSGFHPCVLSVWGNDVYEFPDRSFFNRQMVVGNLCFADEVCSTSEVMAKRARFLTSDLNRLKVVPWGVDINLFRPSLNSTTGDDIVIGTVKSLSHKYGIDILIQAFAKVRDRCVRECPDLEKKLKLLIVGAGPKYTKFEMEIARLKLFNHFVHYAEDETESLKLLVEQLGIKDVTTFTGGIVHEDIPNYLNKLDIYVAASRFKSESFGVAILEASACGKPVVVSNVGGLPEVVLDGKTGYVVPSEDVSAFADKIFDLVKDKNLRDLLGRSGREHVMDYYNWEDNLKQMEAVYSELVDTNS